MQRQGLQTKFKLLSQIKKRMFRLERRLCQMQETTLTLGAKEFACDEKSTGSAQGLSVNGLL